VTVFQVFFGVFVILSVSLYKMITTKISNNFYNMLMGYISSFIIMLVHYLLSKKYKWAALSFSAVQSLNSLITSNELIWLTIKSLDDLDGEGV